MSRSLPEDLLDRVPESGEALYLTRNDVVLGERFAEAAPHLRWRILSRTELTGRGPREILRLLRERPWAVVVLEDGGTEAQRRNELYRGLLLAAKAEARLLVIDGSPVWVTRSLLPGLVGNLLVEGVATVGILLRALWILATVRPRPARPLGRPRSLVFLRTDFWFGVRGGGALTHQQGFLGAAVRQGRAVRVFSTDDVPGLPPGAAVTVVPPAAGPRILEEAALLAYDGRIVGAARRALADSPPDVVVHRHGVFTLAGVLLARALDRPLVLEVNASEVWTRADSGRLLWRGLAERIERRALRAADRVTVVSNILRDELIAAGADPDRIVVNPNGVDPARFDPADRGAALRARFGFTGDDVVAGYAGSFSKWQAPVVADNAVALLRAEPRLRLLLAGEGGLRAGLETRLREEGVADRVVFPGLIPGDELPGLLAACDILLAVYRPFEDGSAWFGSPIKLFENLATGRAVVATRIGQITEVIRDGENGLLVDPHDDGGFREAVLRLARDPELRERLGAAGRRTVEEHYTWEDNARRALDDPEAPGTV